MTVQELLVQISTIASVEGEQVAVAEIRTDNTNQYERVLDLFYNKEENIIYMNLVPIEEE
jgi:hypothetical protein